MLCYFSTTPFTRGDLQRTKNKGLSGQTTTAMDDGQKQIVATGQNTKGCQDRRQRQTKDNWQETKPILNPVFSKHNELCFVSDLNVKFFPIFSCSRKMEGEEDLSRGAIVNDGTKSTS